MQVTLSKTVQGSDEPAAPETTTTVDGEAQTNPLSREGSAHGAFLPGAEVSNARAASFMRGFWENAL